MSNIRFQATVPEAAVETAFAPKSYIGGGFHPPSRIIL